MAKQAILFLIVFVLGNVLTVVYRPIYGLLTYIHVYYNIPTHQYWANEVPDLRWSFVCALFIAISCVLHKQQLSQNSVNYLPLYLQVCYLFLIIGTAFLSPCPQISFGKIYDYLRYVIITVIFIKVIKDLKQYYWVLLLLIVESFNICLLATARYKGGRISDIGLVDAGGSNSFAGVLLLILWMAFAMLFSGSKYVKWAVILMAPFIVNVFMMCGSRGAFLALLTSGAFFFYQSVKEKKLRNKVILFTVIVLIGMYNLLGKEYQARLIELVYQDESEETSQLSAGRTDIWKAGLLMARDYPWGAGGGSFLYLSKDYIPGHLIEKRVGSRASHSTYVLTLVEQGKVGLAIYCLFLTSLIVIAGKSRKLLENILNTEKDPPDRAHLHKLFIHCLVMQVSVIAIATFSAFGDRLYFEMLYIVSSLLLCISGIVKSYILERNEFNTDKISDLENVVG